LKQLLTVVSVRFTQAAPSFVWLRLYWLPHWNVGFSTIAARYLGKQWLSPAACSGAHKFSISCSIQNQVLVPATQSLKHSTLTLDTVAPGQVVCDHVWLEGCDWQAAEGASCQASTSTHGMLGALYQHTLDQLPLQESTQGLVGGHAGSHGNLEQASDQRQRVMRLVSTATQRTLIIMLSIAFQLAHATKLAPPNFATAIPPQARAVSAD
jgi:hypothetical protein